MKYIASELALAMVDRPSFALSVEQIDLDKVREEMRFLPWESRIRHAEVALCLTQLLECEVKICREVVPLSIGDIVLFAHYGIDIPSSPKTARLPQIRWYYVVVCR